jgi:hypothetical protein
LYQQDAKEIWAPNRARAGGFRFAVSPNDNRSKPYKQTSIE